MNAATSLMIEKTSESGASAPQLLTPEIPNLSAGALLRRAREEHGVHLGAMAAALKVPVQKIEALENDAVDLLPDAVFARALAASMCRALRVDPAPILAKLPGAQRPGLAEADKTINARFHSGSARSGRGTRRSSRAFAAVIVLLLVGAVVLYFMPQSLLNTMSASLHKAMQSGSEASEAVAVTTSAQPALSGSSSGVLADTAVEPVAAEMPSALPSPAPATSLEASASLPVASVSGALAAGAQLLVFSARAESWITVTDSHGAVLLKRTLPAGETAGVSGSLPFSVIVGRAASVDVQVRGQPFDLKPLISSGGVARFSVKP
jgi:cytoskeleton protein RodZ